MKTRICLLGVLAFVALATAAPRIWTFQTGVTITGDYVSSGTTMVVIKHDGTNCFLRISDLSSNDLAYILPMQTQQRVDQRISQLNAETNHLNDSGLNNFSISYLENFGNETWDKQGWMDVIYRGLDQYGGRNSLDLGFDVADDSGGFFDHCAVEKEILVNGNYEDTTPNSLVDVITKLKDGDRIRLFGKVWQSADDVMNNNHPESWFIVSQVEMIETKAESDIIKEAQDNASNAAFQAQFFGTNNPPQ